MQLDQAMLDAVRQHMNILSRDITLVLAPGAHEKRDELKAFLTQIASTSPRLHLEEAADPALTTPISFTLRADGTDTGIIFTGIPGGHEFTSLILAILQAGGSALKLDDSIQALIRSIQQPLHFTTYISLSCHNCPDVVQTLNQFALLNPQIRSEMIDGGLFQEQIEARNIQGVPAVYLNGKLCQRQNRHRPPCRKTARTTPRARAKRRARASPAVARRGRHRWWAGRLIRRHLRRAQRAQRHRRCRPHRWSGQRHHGHRKPHLGAENHGPRTRGQTA